MTAGFYSIMVVGSALCLLGGITGVAWPLYVSGALSISWIEWQRRRWSLSTDLSPAQQRMVDSPGPLTTWRHPIRSFRSSGRSGWHPVRNHRAEKEWLRQRGVD